MNKLREKLNSHKELEIILPVIIILMIALPLSYNNNQTKQNSSSGNNSQRRTPEQVVTTPTPTPTTTPDAVEEDNNDLPRKFGDPLDWVETVDYTYKNNITDFDLAFLKEENEEKNKVYSPLSIRYALSMLSDASSGNTKEQIDRLLGSNKPKKYNNSSNMSFSNALFVRDTYKSNIKNSYSQLLIDKYNAEVIYDSFNNASSMNKWVEDKTFKLIKDMFKDETVSQEDFILANALAIDMSWENQIHCVAGTDDLVPCYKNWIYYVSYPNESVEGKAWCGAYSFTSDAYQDSDSPYTGYPLISFNGIERVKTSEVFAHYNKYDIIRELGEDNIRKEVENAYREFLNEEYCQRNPNECTDESINNYLDNYIKNIASNYGKANNSTDYLLYSDDNVKAFGKYLKEYDGVRLMYVGIMPKNESLKDFINNANKDSINNIVKNLKTLKIENFREGVLTIISGNIPFFNYEYSLDLINDLKKMGVEDVFDTTKADLSGLTDTKGAYIDDAAHKTNIEFNNFGIRAAATSWGGGSGNTCGGFYYYFDVPVEKIDLTFDKPYMYLIFDVDTGEVWFTGTVYNPEVKK